MDNQRRRARGLEPLPDEFETPAEPDEAELEQREDNAEYFEEQKRVRAGRVLSAEQIQKAREWEALMKRRRANGA